MNFYPSPIDDIRRTEYPALKGKVYVDHAGSQLPPASLVDAFAQDMKANLHGNPHSESAPSRICGERIDSIRRRALEFFGADPEEYDLIFVANATAAIKLVAEGMRDYCERKPPSKRKMFRRKLDKTQKFDVLYHRDAHTSLVGMRELAGKETCLVSDDSVENWITSLQFSDNRTPTLFAYPGQSNMTGRRLPLTWPSRIRQTPGTEEVFTLLDAAALATTKRLNISMWQPDFVALSFYKVFGFPDLGALVVRKSTGLKILDSRKYFGGGTVDMVIALDRRWHVKKTESPLHARHEDGTLPFHNIIALGHAMDSIQRIFGSMDAISQHTAVLTKSLHEQLVNLKHDNGNPLIKIYNDFTSIYGNPTTQGATVAFSVLDSTGVTVPFMDVERAADAANIFVRTGSLCNPGGVATYLNWTARDLRIANAMGHSCSNPIQVFDGRTTGVVRVSLGAPSSQSDVDAVVNHMQERYTNTVVDSTETLALNGSHGGFILQFGIKPTKQWWKIQGYGRKLVTNRNLATYPCSSEDTVCGEKYKSVVEEKELDNRKGFNWFRCGSRASSRRADTPDTLVSIYQK